VAVLEELAPAQSQAPLRQTDWGKVSSHVALGLYAALIAVVVVRHEPWFDEAQAWLIARDSNPINLFERVRYEGQPGLWHLLLMVPAKTLPYWTLNWISAALGAAGAYVFLRRSPFPTAVKVLVPFTYFLLYQYGAVARNYALLPLSLFCLAVLYRRRRERPAAFAALLFLLANTSAHGFLIAGTFLAIWVVEALVGWWKRSIQLARSQLVAMRGAGAGMARVALMLRPPADRTIASKGIRSIRPRTFLEITGDMINGSFAENWIVLVVALGASLWFFRRMRVLHLYLLPTIVLLLFFGYVHHAPWHEGVLFLVWVFAFWVGLQRWIPGSLWDDRSRWAALGVLALVCAFQVVWTVRTAASDIRAPYSGSEALARHLEAHDLQDKRIFAVHWASFAVNPSFERNIIANYRAPGNVSYYLWSKKNEIIENLTTIEWLLPDFVIYPIKRPGSERNAFRSLVSYEQRAVFWGELFWKGGVLQPEVYILFERKPPPAPPAPGPRRLDESHDW
jgi:hypothetical protein